MVRSKIFKLHQCGLRHDSENTLTGDEFVAKITHNGSSYIDQMKEVNVPKVIVKF